MQVETLQPGTFLFGRFEIINLLGTGSDSVVYNCRDHKNFPRRVALKVLSATALNEDDKIRRFTREIEVLSLVKHPNIIEGRDFFRSEHHLAFSMETIQGNTLSNKLQHESLLKIDEAIDILCQICEGVSAIHRSGYIHRDLKPDNIMLTSQGKVKIIDFGIAISEDTAGGIGSDDGLSGTLDYASPEYIEHGRLDKRSDVYAIGSIGYELLTGMIAFDHPVPIESMRMKINQDPASPAELRVECPLKLSSIILKAMARDPEGRYDTVREILNDLEQLREALGYTREARKETFQRPASSSLSLFINRKVTFAKQIGEFLGLR